MKNKIKDIIISLKESGENWEWYPTTNEIIKILEKEIEKDFNNFSILDIGAGTGKVLMALKDSSKKYAIEKSQILIENMDKDIFIIGTDFKEQTLIDKKVDVIFCNPPYSEYLDWTCKIIKEANAKYVYLVIPDRWEKQQGILDVLDLRKAKCKIIGSFDFKDSEDRKARSKVHLIKIDLKNNYDNSFNIWFDENFKFEADEFSEPNYEQEKNKSDELKALTSKRNLILRLEELYNNELEDIIQNYRMLEKLNSGLFKELNIDIQQIKEGLKLRIEGLKNLYWKELFDNLDTITNRLTYTSRDSLLRTLMENTRVDFTSSNAYSVIIWAIKNANNYYDKQLLDLYLKISDSKNIKLYKSNNRIIEDGWRYSKYEMSHYSLDYRIVHHFYEALDCNSWRTSKNGMNQNATKFIQDIITVAKNLGFDIIDKPEDFQWSAGAGNKFYLKNSGVFAEIKAFKNGNLHFKFMPEFMKKLNLEAGRLNGWIKSPVQASEEFDITEAEAKKMYGGNFVLLKNNVLMIAE